MIKDLLVIGLGPVGVSTALGLAHLGHNVVAYDIDSQRIESLRNGQIPFYELDMQCYLDSYSEKIVFTCDTVRTFKKSKIIFICVGTPLDKNGCADMTAFWNAIALIRDNVRDSAIIVIRSTVPIGTNKKVELYLREQGLADKIKVVSNPEFLAQGTAIHDTIYPERIVIGATDEVAQQEILKLYDKINCKKILTTPESAELIKYESNCYLAMRISFVNDLAKVCELVGADVQSVLSGVSADSRIGEKYFNPSIGYGGSCFPKDTVAFHNQIQKEYGYELELIEATIDINKRQSLTLSRKIMSDFGNIEGLTIAVLGVAFKKNTDDVRNSLAVENINYLKSNGAKVLIWDAKAKENSYSVFGDSVEYMDTVYEAVSTSDIVVITTDWPEIVNMPLTWLKNKHVYDGKNLFLDKDTTEFRYTYIGGKHCKENG